MVELMGFNLSECPQNKGWSRLSILIRSRCFNVRHDLRPICSFHLKHQIQNHDHNFYSPIYSCIHYSYSWSCVMCTLCSILANTHILHVVSMLQVVRCRTFHYLPQKRKRALISLALPVVQPKWWLVLGNTTSDLFLFLLQRELS